MLDEQDLETLKKFFEVLLDIDANTKEEV